MPLNPGDTLLNGHYRILHLLGRGGFGFVYLAQDALLGDQVAIKELIPALLGDESMLKRFLAEARATMRLTHRQIVRTYNVFHEGDNYYIVMEYMAGGSLEEHLGTHGPLPIEAVVTMAAEVCEGLACAHEEQVVHCDLKPANILFDAAGRAKVADFGIAHVSGEMLTRSWHTPAGFVAGTLPYMSPEQADGVRDEPRIDLYALGAVLYRALTGRTYLEFDSRETPRAQAENVGRIYNEQPLPPSQYSRSVPAWLDGVVLKALAKRPEERYASVEAMRAALLQRRAAAAPVTSPSPLPPTRLAPAQPEQDATPTPARQTPPGPGTRRRAPLPTWFWPAAGVAAILFVVLAIAIGAILGNGGGTPAQPTAIATQTGSIDGVEMVYVPAGEFLMGSTDADGQASSDEKPQHVVYLDAFWINKTEVTNAQYAAFLNDQGNQTEGRYSWLGLEDEDCLIEQVDGEYRPKDGYAQHPVVEVTWYGARAYCTWAGGRLPTEAEWEKAARGTDGRKYPWGDSSLDCTKAQYSACSGQTISVGSRPIGASPFGVLDMAGNVWEWVEDWYAGDYYADFPDRNPLGPDSGSYKVLRGGSWGNHQYNVRAAYRGNGYLTLHTTYVGFRCAVSPR